MARPGIHQAGLDRAVGVIGGQPGTATGHRAQRGLVVAQHRGLHPLALGQLLAQLAKQAVQHQAITELRRDT